MKKYYFTGIYLNIFLYVFLMSNDGFLLKPKYVVRNTNYMTLVVFYGLYFPFYLYRVLLGKLEGIRLGIFKPRWEDNIKTNGIGRRGFD
jgi:hypothetical protein